MKTKFAELHEQLQHSEGEKPNLQQLMRMEDELTKAEGTIRELQQQIQKVKRSIDDQCAYEQQVHIICTCISGLWLMCTTQKAQLPSLSKIRLRIYPS